jgi:hypothetical protein
MFEARPTNRNHDTAFCGLRQNPCLKLLSGSHENASRRIANSWNRYGIDTSPDDGDRPLPRTYGCASNRVKHKDIPWVGSERPPTANSAGSRSDKTNQRVQLNLLISRQRSRGGSIGCRKQHLTYSRLDLERVLSLIGRRVSGSGVLFRASKRLS